MKLLVATRDRRVFDVLENARQESPNADWDVIVALDTGAIYKAVPQVDVAIVDYRDLVFHPFTLEFVRTLLSHASLEECDPDAFVANPERFLGGRPGRRRKVLDLPEHKVVAFTSYSGGTGKTTLAMDTAWQFVSKTRNVIELPAAVLEFSYGASALQTLVGTTDLTLTDLVLQPEVSPYRFHGISLYPMDYPSLKNIASDQVTRYLCEQIASNTLTVIDAGWPHGYLTTAIGEEVDLWVVVTTPRADAVENARKLHDELAEIYGEHKVIIAANQVGSLGATLALWGTPHELQIERHSLESGVYSGRLGKKVLMRLYGSLWDAYERAGKGRRRWFRRRERQEKPGDSTPRRGAKKKKRAFWKKSPNRG